MPCSIVTTCEAVTFARFGIGVQTLNFKNRRADTTDTIHACLACTCYITYLGPLVVYCMALRPRNARWTAAKPPAQLLMIAQALKEPERLLCFDSCNVFCRLLVGNCSGFLCYSLSGLFLLPVFILLHQPGLQDEVPSH